jgi:hypothetical protein
MMAQNEDHQDLYEITKQLRQTMNALFLAQNSWKVEIIQAIQRDHQQQLTSNSVILPPRSALEESLTRESEVRFNEGLLRWVCFTELETRHEKIASAYEKTFTWIYHPPPDDRWSDFSAWLEDENECVYWVTGKPAAGKSTLLKFIYNDERTTKHLVRWAGEKKLIYCAFYFWNSGTSLQMSKEGMLRTLIYTALRQAPELWTVLFPSKMEEYILFADPWLVPITSDEVTCAFRSLVKGAGTQYRLFFFIDGLDEYGGDHDQLLAMVQSLSSPDIKTCVSSRAWPVFEDGFRGRPSLRLEAITYGDIKHYVTSRFTNSPGFQERRLETPSEINQLIEAITSKASGVFLWVRLVTDSLLKGLAEGDRLEELRERLNDIPDDLEKLFWKILTNVDQERREHVSQLLQIMRGSLEQLSVLDFSYADDPDPDVVGKALYGAPDPQQAEGRARRMRRRLKVCCKGLLEAEAEHQQPITLAHVTYLHRTVRDYLERPEIWSQFLVMAGDDFNFSLRMFHVHALRVKMNTETPGIYTDFWYQVLHAIEYAVRTDPNGRLGLQVRLLKELDHVATCVIDRRISNNTSSPGQTIGARMHWSSLKKGGQFNTSFIHLAIQLQLTQFVRQHILEEQKHPLPVAQRCQEANLRLLMATLQYDRFSKDPALSALGIVPNSPNAELTALFLQQGADPNHKMEGALKSHGNITGAYSTWECHLREPDRATESWTTISKVLLENKADPSLITSTTTNIPQEVLTLAQQKSRDQRTETKKHKFRRLGAVFRVEKLRKTSNARIAVI